MFQSLKKFWLAAGLLCLLGQPVFGYVTLGPVNEAYQVDVIGYNLQNANELGLGNQNGDVDVGAPKSFGQGYRWNVPVVYYAFDAGFATYFGPQGMAEVDKAFAFYNSLSNVSSYSANLTEFPLRASRINAAAQALGLVDIKSTVMHLIVEQLGLGQPDRYVWCLHDRILPAGAACPNFEYIIIQRNFDPITKQFSSFVNNALYGYSIVDLCPINPAPFGALLADAIEYDVDPKTEFNLALASGLDLNLVSGTFYTSLTKDDMGGLRALYSATNVIKESTGANINQAVPDTGPTILTTQDYATFLQQASVNNAAALIGLYPGLIITSTTNYITNVFTTNFTAVVSHSPQGPAGTFTTTLVPTVTTQTVARFIHTFANVVILPGHLYTNAYVGFQTTSVTTSPIGPAGTLQTNTVTSAPLTPGITNGDFYILPLTLCGDYFNITTQQQVITTNITPIPITFTGITNVVPPVENAVSFSTNYILSVFAVNCVANTVNLRKGIEKITFIRQDFDSILGSAWTPQTNFYTQVAVTNNAPVLQTFRRIITQPDILFTTADLASGPAATPADSEVARTPPNYNATQVANNQFGPGTIQPQITFTFNNTGPVFINEGTGFIGSAGAGVTPDANGIQEFQWGSFDGTTNLPVIYPNSNSLAQLEAQIFFQITTPSPLVYSLSKPFSVQLMASGGTPFVASSGKPPYLWPTAGITLPAGLTLSSSGLLSGTLTGVNAGTPPFVFNVQAEDSGLRLTEAALTIMIVP